MGRKGKKARKNVIREVVKLRELTTIELMKFTSKVRKHINVIYCYGEEEFQAIKKQYPPELQAELLPSYSDKVSRTQFSFVIDDKRINCLLNYYKAMYRQLVLKGIKRCPLCKRKVKSYWLEKQVSLDPGGEVLHVKYGIGVYAEEDRRFSLDHNNPHANKGEDSPYNEQLVCHECNLDKACTVPVNIEVESSSSLIAAKIRRDVARLRRSHVEAFIDDRLIALKDDPKAALKFLNRMNEQLLVSDSKVAQLTFGPFRKEYEKWENKEVALGGVTFREEVETLMRRYKR